MRAQQVMSAPVVTVRPDDGVKRAAELLSRHGFTALPVVDEDDRLVGMVTEADLVRERFPADPRFRTAESDGAPRPPGKVREVMTTPAVAMGAGTDVAVLARTMVDDRRRCVPIVSGSRVVGVVTRRDLVRLLARPDAEIAADVLHRLRDFGGAGRWRIAVDGGAVTITDSFAPDQCDPTDGHVARVLAEAVPGVVHAEVAG
ncbi:CBS domain-containing protein [Actinokineospora sp. PR83]|uniref:CBS domain-containing protein n=1 Tax=Actinokineospora sp. PR83 TaxID=2884908 RepID=UPI001F249580|nr:CBS domain-containing protein [Actinokineospora sp. PR83]MCG8915560.1 CBS domain-containing protein [Actinokineospora sp. PR83]